MLAVVPLSGILRRALAAPLAALLTVPFAVPFAVLLAVLLPSGGAPLPAQARPAAIPRDAGPFEPVARVLMHPRCLNCHQTEAPRQTDRGIRHTQGVVRGTGGRGAPGQPCAACHQTTNSANAQVPGALHWHLAPATMSWEGLTAGDICRQIKDPSRNGNRRGSARIIEHMATDPLVLWAWQPGDGRSTPAIPHAAFLSALRAWADRGLPCPD